jgi:pantoate--beta-alanine ligase
MQLTVTKDMEAFHRALLGPAREGKRLALVPTMGALHAGHLSLVEHAKTLADTVAMTIFVNPKQFGPNEDFAKYPRALENDINLAEKAGVEIIYAPDVDDLYPEGYSTSVSAGPLSTQLCGKFRPGHFDGVATVVSKLLLRAMPHVAVFGEKDYQQLCIIRRVVDDLDIAVDIVGAPTVRESDGLAMSSRNTYLTASERAIAPKLYDTLVNTGRDIIMGNITPKAAIADATKLLTALGFKVDYLELRDSDTLSPMDDFEPPARLLVAAWLGKTRLIDNIPLE